MKAIIAGATGFIGRTLTKRWTGCGVEVLAVGRSKKRLREVLGTSVGILDWQDIAADTGKLIDNIDVIVNLAGAGVADGLWTERRKNEILQSRIKATKTLAAFAAGSRKKKPVLLNASAIGIYGLTKNKTDRMPPAFDERSETDDDSFLSHVCGQWEDSTQAAVHNGNQVVLMRFGHVLGKEGGMLKKMVLPFSLGLGGVLGNGNQMMSWISLDDLCSVMDFLIEHEEISGPVNCVSPHAITNRGFSKSLAKALKRPCFLRAPDWVLRLLLREMADELFLNSQIINPDVLSKKGFEFRDTDINSFFERKMV